MTPTPSRSLQTERLALRPPVAADATPMQALCANWNVVRMTSRMPHPYTLDDARTWLAAREARWADRTEYTFAVTQDGAFAGVIGIDLKNGEYEIGYWLGEPWWGRGLATEAVERVIRFGFDELGLDCLKAGHFDDNPASGRVLVKCGFRYIGEDMLYSAARGGEARSLLMDLTRDHERTKS
jgi:RimJ/RimL family protein N-acetyltransferase